MYTIIFMVVQLFLIVNSKSIDEEIKNIFHSEFCLHGLCDNATDYNEDKVIQLLPKYQKYLPLFGQVIDLPPSTKSKESIESRFKSDEANNMCATKLVTMYPKKGRTINGGEKFIVNVPGYHQSVTFQACEEGTECYAKKEYLPLGATSFCENQFIIIRLVVINEDSTIGMEQFAIPSGCSCMYQVN